MLHFSPQQFHLKKTYKATLILIMERKIAIVGAGISGLLSCKYCLSKGFRPLVFESESSIGGVWTRTLKTTKLQTFRTMYQFSDFPWPPSVTEDLPSQKQVMEYIKSYADHFDLNRYIKFNSKAVGISYEGPSSEAEMQKWSLWGGTGQPLISTGNKWHVTVENTQSQLTEVYQADFVILCVGRFKDVPNIPEFPPGNGPEVFKGKVIHSMEYAAMEHEKAAEFVKGKRVVVVGFQKTGVDIAMECSSVNGTEYPCTVVYRNDRWKLPDYHPWGIPLALLYFNRFAELMVHKPGEGLLLSLLATTLSPLRWGISKMVESHIKRKLPLAKFDMVPQRRFSEDVRSCVFAFMHEDFFQRVEKGSIQMKRTPHIKFYKEGILTGAENKPIQTDLVILATGFRSVEKLQNIFISQAFRSYIAPSPDARVPLYRECIHPKIPQLAIVGHSEGVSNLYTSELRCRWIAELIDGTFKLPSIIEMENDVRKWDEYMIQSSGEYYQRSCIASLEIWYNDQLCKDMGWNHKRKRGYLAEIFEPYGPMDYANP